MKKINAAIYGFIILLSFLNAHAVDFKEAELITTVLPDFRINTVRPDRYVGSGVIEFVFIVDKKGSP